MTIAAAEYRDRRDQLLEACSDLELGALLVLANGGCFGLSGVSQGYMSFLCGWNSFDSPSALILRRGQKPFLLVAHHRMKMMALDHVPDVEVDWIDQNEFGNGVARALRSKGATPRRIGVCGWEDVVAKSWKSGEIALAGVELIDIKERFIPLRSVKSEAQLAVHRQVAQVCDDMFAALAKMSVVGRYTYDIKAELEFFAKRRGCEFVQHWMTVGEAPDYPRYFHHESRQIPKPRDILLYGMMMTLDGIWGHAVRCYRIGKPDLRQVRIQEAIVQFQKSFVSLMKPGHDLAEIVPAGLKMTSSIHEAIGDPGARMMRLGHGLGCSYTEPGISDPFPRSYYAAEEERTRSRRVILRSGMVFEVHPIFFYSDGGAGVGDMVEIGEDGPHFMTHFPRGITQMQG